MNDSTNDPSPDETTDERPCEALELEDGELVLYDPENHRAWLQSDRSVAVADRA